MATSTLASDAVPVLRSIEGASRPARRTTDGLLLLCSIILVAAALTWIVPAGHYERFHDARTGYTRVVPGSYTPSAALPVGPWGVLLAIPEGLVAAADVIFFVLVAGAALTVVEITGAMGGLLDLVATRFASRPLVVLLVVSSLFLFCGASYAMYEEILAFIPLLYALMRRLRMSGTMAVAVSMGSASVAATFSPFNTFHLGISQPIAGVPLFSGFAFRSVVFVIAIAAWIGYLMCQGHRMRHGGTDGDLGPRETDPTDDGPAPPATLSHSMTLRHVVVLAALGAGLGIMIAGAILWSFAIVHFTGVLVGVAVFSGLAGGLTLRGTSQAVQEGLRRMAYAAVLVGVARAIYVVLEHGAILDTMTHALFRPLAAMPPAGAGVVMLVSQSLLALPIPSDSGRAMVSLPILVPLSDLLHVSRQAVVLAYQYAGLVSSTLAPTTGAMLAMLALAEVPLGRWLRFMLPIYLVLACICVIAMVIAIRIGVQ